MWEIDFILDKYKKTIDSYNEFNNICEKTNSWHELRNLSINKLINNEYIDELWINNAENIKEELPLEACLLLSRYINDPSLDKYSKKIIDILYNKIEFSLPGEVLSKLIQNIIIDESYRNKKNILLIKFNNLKEIHIKDPKKEHTILGIKINNISKLEIISYSPNLKNYIYVPNEDIEIIELDTGNVLSKYMKPDKKKNHSSYITLNDMLRFQQKTLHVESSFERILLYEVVSEIHFKEVSTTLNNNIVNIILDNQDLFEKEYITTISKDIKAKNKNQTVTYINELIKNPNNKTLQRIIRETENIEVIFSVLKQAETILQEEIRLDIYFEAICKCNDIAENNKSNSASKINIALFCEELIAEKPIIFTELINILKSMYKDKIFTNKTVETLKYLKHTVKDEQIIDDILLQIKYENCEFDNDYVDKIINAQNNLSELNIEVIDKMLNKLICNEKDISKYKNDLFEQIYNFYKRNNDLNALDKLCMFCHENNKNISTYNITDKDINKLIKFYKHKKKELDKNYNLKLINEFKYNKDIFEYGKLTIESIYMNNDEESIDLLNSKYSQLLKFFKKKSDIIYDEYLKMLEHSDSTLNLDELINLTEEEVNDINNILMKRTTHESTKLRMLKVLINYYIIKKSDESILDYMNLYMNSYSKSDNGRLFKNILFNHTENIDFIEVVLNNIDFNYIPNAEIFMEIISKKLIDNNRIDLLPEVLRYYISNEKYENGLSILKVYVDSNIGDENRINLEIDQLKYEMYISPILDNIDEKSKRELYEILIKRDDLPIHIREKYFYLLPSDENKMHLIDSFVFEQTQSLLAKEFAIEEYYNNDDEFCRFVNIGSKNSEKVYNLVYEKVKKQFANNKDYVEKLIRNIYKEDKRISKIYEYIQDYNYNIFDKSSQNVFGDYVCISREKGEYADKLLIKNIFDNSELEVIGFTDEEDKVDNCIYNYLGKIGANYNQIDTNIIIINENNNFNIVKDGNLLGLIENIKLLIKLQRDLIINKRILIEFNEDIFILNEKGFIPNSYKYIYKYTEEFKVKSKSSKNKHNKINEKKICDLTKSYLKDLLLKLDILDEEEKIKNNFLSDILDNSSIKTYEEFIASIEIFIEKQSKAFESLSYKEKLTTFDNLDYFEQLDVISDILNKKDTSIQAKNIILKFDNDFYELDLYTKYLIECFNNSNLGFDDDDYLNIYNKINNNISENVIKEITNEIFNFYINAKHKCKLYANDMKNDINNLKLSKDDKEYLISRI